MIDNMKKKTQQFTIYKALIFACKGNKLNLAASMLQNLYGLYFWEFQLVQFLFYINAHPCERCCIESINYKLTLRKNNARVFIR